MTDHKEENTLNQTNDEVDESILDQSVNDSGRSPENNQETTSEEKTPQKKPKSDRKVKRNNDNDKYPANKKEVKNIKNIKNPKIIKRQIVYTDNDQCVVTIRLDGDIFNIDYKCIQFKSNKELLKTHYIPSVGDIIECEKLGNLLRKAVIFPAPKVYTRDVQAPWQKVKRKYNKNDHRDKENVRPKSDNHTSKNGGRSGPPSRHYSEMTKSRDANR